MGLEDSLYNSSTVGNVTSKEEEGDGWIWDDATWILCSSFIIFTMQTGTATSDMFLYYCNCLYLLCNKKICQ